MKWQLKVAYKMFDGTIQDVLIVSKTTKGRQHYVGVDIRHMKIEELEETLPEMVKRLQEVKA